MTDAANAAKMNRAPGSVVEPMTAWAEFEGGNRWTVQMPSGPEALAWMVRATAAGATKVGYRPC